MKSSSPAPKVDRAPQGTNQILQEIIGSGDEESFRRLEETIRKLDDSRRRPSQLMSYTVVSARLQHIVYGHGAASVSRSLREFQRQFASEEACQEYLAACRWPDGFKCPRCGNQRAYVMTRLWQCAACRHQVSLTSGTILHNTRVSLVLWFWAAYLMTTDKRGISALLLQRQLELRRYETAWMMLHKLRRAMVNVAREPLRGEVEIDEAWIGGPQAGLRGSRQLKGRQSRSLSWWPLRNAARRRGDCEWL